MSTSGNNRYNGMEEIVDHALMLLETLAAREDSPETAELRRDVLRLYRHICHDASAEALRGGTITPHPELLSVGGILHEIFQEAQYEAILHHITLREDLGSCVFCMADEEMLRTILWNLLQNAMSAVGENGEILLRAENVPEGCRITIMDNGIGFGDIAPEVLLERAEASSGLGLIREYLKLNDSQLKLERQENQTLASFILATPPLRMDLNAPTPRLRYLQGLSKAEIELSVLN